MAADGGTVSWAVGDECMDRACSAEAALMADATNMRASKIGRCNRMMTKPDDTEPQRT